MTETKRLGALARAIEGITRDHDNACNAGNLAKKRGMYAHRATSQEYRPALIGIGGSVQYLLPDVEACETRHRREP